MYSLTNLQPHHVKITLSNPLSLAHRVFLIANHGLPLSHSAFGINAMPLNNAFAFSVAIRGVIGAPVDWGI